MNLAYTSFMLACLSYLAWKFVLTFESNEILPNFFQSSASLTLISNYTFVAILL